MNNEQVLQRVESLIDEVLTYGSINIVDELQQIWESEYGSVLDFYCKHQGRKESLSRCETFDCIVLQYAILRMRESTIRGRYSDLGVSDEVIRKDKVKNCRKYKKDNKIMNYIFADFQSMYKYADRIYIGDDPKVAYIGDSSAKNLNVFDKVYESICKRNGVYRTWEHLEYRYLAGEISAKDLCNAFSRIPASATQYRATFKGGYMCLNGEVYNMQLGDVTVSDLGFYDELGVIECDARDSDGFKCTLLVLMDIDTAILARESGDSYESSKYSIADLPADKRKFILGD